FGHVSGPVHFPIAIERNGIVFSVDQRHLDQLAWSSVLLGCFEILGAQKILAAHHPLLWLPLPKNNGIEGDASKSFNRKNAASALVELRECDPDFECFFAKFL